MKRKILLPVAIVTFSITGFLACRKAVISTESTSGNAQAKHLKSGTTVNIDPGNANNQYDAVGLMHNEVMLLMANDSFINANTRSDFYLRKIKQVMEKHNINTDQLALTIEAAKSEIIRADQSFMLNGNLEAYISDLYNRRLICSEQKDFLAEMDAEVDRISSYQREMQSDFQALQKLISNMKTIENRIVSSTSLNEQQKQVLLSTSSTYKYSMTNYFNFIYSSQHAWRGYFDNKGIDNPPGHITLPDLQPTTWVITGADWAKVGHADAGGAVGGAAAAGVGALFAAVTWPIVVGAALGGGVGESVQELYNQWVEGKVHIRWECC